MRKAGGSAAGAAWREKGSPGSCPSITRRTATPSATVPAKTVTTSTDRQAGTTPVLGTSPGVGLTPTRLLKAAGTRPDPAVSVPSAKAQSPAATATADPDDDPPET